MFEMTQEGWLKVPVTQDEKNQCKVVGQQRTHYQKVIRGNADNPEYAGKTFRVMGADQDALGVMAEMAVVKALGLPTFDLSNWSYYVEDNRYKLPEIMWFLEVRRVNSPANPLKVFRKDVRDNALNVKTYIDFEAENGRVLSFKPYVYIQGWREATRGFEQGQYKSEDLRHVHKLEEPETLMEAFYSRLGFGYEVAA
ncbi:hypothetical protein PV735_38755 [Streptomyces turgidiscabies]|uniref:hypothetical protein n=1 Tax=Streptomyces TaxID=1883 RepID=UPI00076EB74D|nr:MULTISPECIES: hypothetical protein [Streptomyces]MDX3498590.1 hypothetical protein [Streptomyces turgidiscabies]GAQ73610.1 hypothetical protein T45_05370 [Streptomyces turgidiscabies]